MNGLTKTLLNGKPYYIWFSNTGIWGSTPWGIQPPDHMRGQLTFFWDKDVSTWMTYSFQGGNRSIETVPDKCGILEYGYDWAARHNKLELYILEHGGLSYILHSPWSNELEEYKAIRQCKTQLSKRTGVEGCQTTFMVEKDNFKVLKLIKDYGNLHDPKEFPISAYEFDNRHMMKYGIGPIETENAQG